MKNPSNVLVADMKINEPGFPQLAPSNGHLSPIDFYFDFSSPYGYLASERIEDLSQRYARQVVWHPVLLGVAFKSTGAAPLPSIPLKGDYAMRDIARSARYLQVPYTHPTHFPIPTHHAARGFLWLQDRNPQLAKSFAQETYRAYFTQDVNIAEIENLLAIAEMLEIDRHEFAAALSDVLLKERLKAEVDLALVRGVFGSPYFIVGGEPFWGVDRLPQLEKWLADGGF